MTAAQSSLAKLSDTTAVQNQLKWGLVTDCKTNPRLRGSREKILNDVSAKMTTATLTQLNKQIAVDQMDIAAVAKAWLTSVGLVS